MNARLGLPVLAALTGALVLAFAAMGSAAWAEPVVAGLLPVAVNDTLSAKHDRTTSVPAPGVLENDVLVGSGFTAVLNSGTTHGTVSLASNGGYTYTPNTGYLGTDQFRYHVDGGLLGLSNIATVTITVTNAAPVAVANSYTATAGVLKTVAAPGVLGNDSDADGDALTAGLVSGVSHGSLSLAANGGFSYTASAGYSGGDSFSYRASDGLAWSAAVTVSLTISLPPPTPTPAPTPTAAPTTTPAPTPSRASTPAPTPAPTSSPGPTSSPAPTATPTGPPGATPAPTGTPGPDGSADPSASPQLSPDPFGPGGSTAPSAAPPGVSPLPSSGPGGIGSVGGPGAGGGSAGGSTIGGSGGGKLSVPEIATDQGITISDLGLTFQLSPFAWLVPGFFLGLPGLLLILIVLAQMGTGATFLVLSRRSLGAFGLGRRRRGPDDRDGEAPAQAGRTW